MYSRKNRNRITNVSKQNVHPERDELGEKNNQPENGFDMLYRIFSGQVNKQLQSNLTGAQQPETHNSEYSDFRKRFDEQHKNVQELKKQIKSLLESNSPLIEILKELPRDYPMSSIVVKGAIIDVSNFITVTPNYIAYFKNGEKLVIMDVRKIDGIEL